MRTLDAYTCSWWMLYRALWLAAGQACPAETPLEVLPHHGHCVPHPAGPPSPGQTHLAATSDQCKDNSKASFSVITANYQNTLKASGLCSQKSLIPVALFSLNSPHGKYQLSANLYKNEYKGNMWSIYEIYTVYIYIYIYTIYIYILNSFNSPEKPN